MSNAVDPTFQATTETTTDIAADEGNEAPERFIDLWDIPGEPYPFTQVHKDAMVRVILEEGTQAQAFDFSFSRYESDLAPGSQMAAYVVERILGTVYIDGHSGTDWLFAGLLPGAGTVTGMNWRCWYQIDEWLSWVITPHVPGASAEGNARAIARVLERMPWPQPCKSRADAYRGLVEYLLTNEGAQQVLKSGSPADVRALVENTALAYGDSLIDLQLPSHQLARSIDRMNNLDAALPGVSGHIWVAQTILAAMWGSLGEAPNQAQVPEAVREALGLGHMRVLTRLITAATFDLETFTHDVGDHVGEFFERGEIRAGREWLWTLMDIFLRVYGLVRCQQNVDNPLVLPADLQHWQNLYDCYVAESSVVHEATGEENPLVELEALTGLSGVKEQVRSLVAQVKLQQLRAAHDIHVESPTRHAVFVGNPGTAKTTVARLMARIYKELGLLSQGHLVEVSRSDLVGQFIGHTEKQTAEVVQRALGGVLFIDEAYTLAQGGSNDFGMQAVTELLKQMEDHRDDLVVIVAGYNAEMNKFMQLNPGLQSRFATTISFNDYSDDELVDILTSMAADSGGQPTPEFIAGFREAVPSPRPDAFGNGRWVRLFLDRAWEKQAMRLNDEIKAGRTPSRDELQALTADDVPHIGKRARGVAPDAELDAALARLNALVGLESVKEHVRRLVAEVKLADRRAALGQKIDPPSRHMIFQGSPGTAKTTVARVLGDIYRALGILSTGNFVEVSRSDLVGAYIGHTERNTREKLDEAMGGVFFLDEAYALSHAGFSNDFGKEAIEVILKYMEDRRDDLVVICAGYTEEMEEFLRVNPGLSSRIPHRLTFPDYSDDELVTLMKSQVASKGFILSDDFEAAFMAIIPTPRPRDFGNGRWVRTVVEQAISELNGRLDPETATGDELRTLTAADLGVSIQASSIVPELPQF